MLYTFPQLYISTRPVRYYIPKQTASTTFVLFLFLLLAFLGWIQSFLDCSESVADTSFEGKERDGGCFSYLCRRKTLFTFIGSNKVRESTGSNR